MKSLAMLLALAIGAVAGVAAHEDSSATQAVTPGVTPIATQVPAPTPTPEKKTEITSVYGTVSAYEPGHTITLLLPNATTATYTIDSSASIPTDVAKGSKVIVRTVTRPGASQPIVRKVTHTKTSRKTKTG